MLIHCCVRFNFTVDNVTIKSQNERANQFIFFGRKQVGIETKISTSKSLMLMVRRQQRQQQQKTGPVQPKTGNHVC